MSFKDPAQRKCSLNGSYCYLHSLWVRGQYLFNFSQFLNFSQLHEFSKFFLFYNKKIVSMIRRAKVTF